MFSSQPGPSTSKVHIFIPQIKRFRPENHFQQGVSPGRYVFSHETSFESLKVQLKNVQPQLGLITQNSLFTKVSLIEDECPDNFKQQNTRATFLNQDPEPFKLDLNKFIQLLEKAEFHQPKDKKQFTFNTKNILRNVCNAQSQYILFNQSAEQIIASHLSNIQQFKTWVNKLRFHTFEEFQKVWSCKRRPVFTKLYKKLCRKFYRQNAIPYILNSRIKNKQTKIAHIRYLYRFLQGLEEPEKFYYFKQKQKELPQKDI